MLHIYNDCTIDWHQVCVNMWSGFGRVAHTKYHPSCQGQNEGYVAHLQWLYHWLAPSMCKYVKRFGPSRTHKVPPLFRMDGCMDRRTHGHESYVPHSGHSPRGDNNTWKATCCNIWPAFQHYNKLTRTV